MYVIRAQVVGLRTGNTASFASSASSVSPVSPASPAVAAYFAKNIFVHQK